jgi:hypothetical protein
VIGELFPATGGQDHERGEAHPWTFPVDPPSRKPQDARVTERLLLDERIRADGTLARTWGSIEGAKLRVIDDDGVDGTLSVDALDRVMTRFARPLDDGVALDGPALEAGGARRLRRLRYHTPVDATGRDYLVWERPDQPPIAVLATMATAALRYLVLRLGAESPRKTEG